MVSHNESIAVVVLSSHVFQMPLCDFCVRRIWIIFITSSDNTNICLVLVLYSKKQ